MWYIIPEPMPEVPHEAHRKLNLIVEHEAHRKLNLLWSASLKPSPPVRTFLTSFQTLRQNDQIMNEFLKIAGDYTQWKVYKKSVIICDVTELFIRRAFTEKTRTIDQMRQAARSCKQNIVEGCGDGTVSVEMCIKLLGVARGSVRELMEDYGDYLRQNDLETWTVDDTRTLAARKYCMNNDDPKEFVRKCKERSDETVANIMITQIRQIDAMLTKVLKKLEADFIANGGIKEAMAAARRKQRGY